MNENGSATQVKPNCIYKINKTSLSKVLLMVNLLNKKLQN